MNIEGLNGAIGGLLECFSDSGWRAEGEGTVIFDSDDGKHYLVYTNGEGGPDCEYQEITLWNNEESRDTGGLMFKLEQEIEGEKIEYRISVPPFIEQYWSQATGKCGVVYESDGEMYPVRRVRGLPRKIDMDKTVELFLKQVAEKDFSKPVLVRAERTRDNMKI